MNRELIAVVPVYNEADNLRAMVSEWSEVFDSVSADWEMLLLNDGSKDASADVLAELAGEHARLTVVDKTNEGHGPTILRGYADAVSRADWVFQTDSDLEVAPSDFPDMWQKREQADLLVGFRHNRTGPKVRGIVTSVLRSVLKVFYSASIRDANCPFRLMRSDAVRSILPKIPIDTFAPNPIIIGAAGLKGLNLLELPVTYSPRTAGEVSIKKWGLLKAAAKSLWQTIALRSKLT